MPEIATKKIIYLKKLLRGMGWLWQNPQSHGRDTKTRPMKSSNIQPRASVRNSVFASSIDDVPSSSLVLWVESWEIA